MAGGARRRARDARGVSAVLNRVLDAHRIATADPHPLRSPLRQALVIGRAGARASSWPRALGARARAALAGARGSAARRRAAPRCARRSASRRCSARATRRCCARSSRCARVRTSTRAACHAATSSTGARGRHRGVARTSAGSISTPRIAELERAARRASPRRRSSRARSRRAIPSAPSPSTSSSTRPRTRRSSRTF